MPIAKRAGFTLIELLVVVVIIGILASVAMSAFRDAQDRSRNSSMISNVRSVQMGIEQWRTDFTGLPGDLVVPGNTDASKALAADPGSAQNWKNPDDSAPQKYVPGYMLPRTPWAKLPQSEMDPNYKNNASTFELPIFQDLIVNTRPLSSVMAEGYVVDGGQEGGKPPAADAPKLRQEYGYMYYVGEASSSRYVVMGAGKVKGQAYIVGCKSNF